MSGSESLKLAPERAMCEEVKVKPKLQLGPHDVGNGRNMEHLLRKVTGNM
jgi:hypothetical protein